MAIPVPVEADRLSLRLFGVAYDELVPAGQMAVLRAIKSQQRHKDSLDALKELESPDQLQRVLAAYWLWGSAVRESAEFTDSLGDA